MSELRFVFDTFNTEQALHFVVVFLPVGRTSRLALCCQAYQDHRLRSSAADPPDKMLEAQEISILLPSSRRRRSRRRRSRSRRHRVFIGAALLQRTTAIRSAKGSLNADCLAIQCTVILDLCLSDPTWRLLSCLSYTHDRDYTKYLAKPTKAQAAVCYVTAGFKASTCLPS